MRYAVLAGGKRIRPILCLAAAEAAGGDPHAALLPGVAIEILHTYTLIHDDLPCMDDDDLRRGQPACHIRFGEANALLAGDALLTLAFEWAAQAEPAAALVGELAQAAGHAGVIAGQVEDLAAEGRAITANGLEHIHHHKTGALLRAALRMGALTASPSTAVLEAVTRFGHNIGLAFQIVDDILDVTADEKDLGKPVGSDDKADKATYVKLLGLDASRAKATGLAKDAHDALTSLPGNTAPLAGIADYIVNRTK